ncbi:hypothetical protein SAMN05216428_103161 [Nitrosospira sp. Nsp11]|nr:hypothetical protein SAMN05216315_10494 [Nitrosospira sp. Nsp18]SHL54532.1 hypothetical protein SAMN05216428_103161 [Nitrosospira sp. Nsp11]
MGNLGGLQSVLSCRETISTARLSDPDRWHLISYTGALACYRLITVLYLRLSSSALERNRLRQRRLSTGNHTLGNIPECFIHLVDENKA